MGFHLSKEERTKRLLRVIKTLFFLITMFISLLLLSAPIFLVIADTLLPSVLLSAFLSPSSFSLQTLSSHLTNYDFRYSLIDIPLISIVRSAVILCNLLFLRLSYHIFRILNIKLSFELRNLYMGCFYL